jgi:hypothetical protein
MTNKDWLSDHQKALLEKQAGRDVGKDPRNVSKEELEKAGHKPMSPTKALRLRCLDCCGGQPNEVRLCTSVKCPSWPWRMGKNPWRAPLSNDRLEAMRQRGGPPRPKIDSEPETTSGARAARGPGGDLG